MASKKDEHRIHANNDLEKRIMEAFEVFDHSGKQVVDVREVGTILRSLGCCPTEAEVQEVILATENKEATGNVPLYNFMPYMFKAMIEHRFYPASAEMLLAAFRYFDTEGRGFLTKERFTQLMLEEGEPFTQEEFDEMMHTALDPVSDTITYEYYINQLMICKSNFKDGISCGMMLLFETLGKVDRMTSRWRNGTEKNIQDIITLFEVIDPDDVSVFVANGLHRLPLVRFDHVDVTRMLKDITVLKISLAEVQSKLKMF